MLWTGSHSEFCFVNFREQKATSATHFAKVPECSEEPLLKAKESDSNMACNVGGGTEGEGGVRREYTTTVVALGHGCENQHPEKSSECVGTFFFKLVLMAAKINLKLTAVPMVVFLQRRGQNAGKWAGPAWGVGGA